MMTVAVAAAETWTIHDKTSSFSGLRTATRRSPPQRVLMAVGRLHISTVSASLRASLVVRMSRGHYRSVVRLGEPTNHTRARRNGHGGHSATI